MHVDDSRASVGSCVVTIASDAIRPCRISKMEFAHHSAVLWRWLVLTRRHEENARGERYRECCRSFRCSCSDDEITAREASQNRALLTCGSADWTHRERGASNDRKRVVHIGTGLVLPVCGEASELHRSTHLAVRIAPHQHRRICRASSRQ